MIAVLKLIGWAVLLIVVAGVAVIAFGPREPVDTTARVDPAGLPEELDAWLAAQEAAVPDLREGAAKRIVWAGEAGAVTPLSIIYLHGFSATAEEIRPVPDIVAEALGANLFFTRLAGHGRDGAAMTDPVAGDWVADLAEGLAVGRRIGERVLILANSTGGTLAAIAATEPDLTGDLAGIVFVSPNFGIANPAAGLLTLPFGRTWVPVVAGGERGFDTRNDEHAAHWTSRYPTIAAIPLGALVEHAAARDYTRTTVPALFLYSEHDTVVSPEATHAVYEAWGGPKARELLVMGPEDDVNSHVIAGDILSPGQTDRVAMIITDWVKGL